MQCIFLGDKPRTGTPADGPPTGTSGAPGVDRLRPRANGQRSGGGERGETEFVLTVTDFGDIYRRPHVHSEIRWPQVLFQKQVIANSLFLDLLTREAGKASHMTVNLSKEPLFEGQTGLSPQNP
jgi:hypothetical protein